MSALPDPAAVLAHGPQARFVREVVSIDADAVVCRGRIPPASPAAADGEAASWAAIELAAQAAALLGGHGSGAPSEPAIGYLVRVRDARFARPTVPADAELLARVERIGGAGALSLFRARVELDGRTVASATLGTFVERD